MNVEQAKIAEQAGACAVMALERIPADIRREGGVARMSDPVMIKVCSTSSIHLHKIHRLSFISHVLFHFFFSTFPFFSSLLSHTFVFCIIN